jgi:hypothetical protein
VIFAIVLAGYAKGRHHFTETVPPQRESFLWMEWTTGEQTIHKYGDVSWGELAMTVLLPTVIFGFVHPIIGRVVSFTCEQLCDAIDSVYQFSDKEFGCWKPDGALAVGMLWPITMFLIPLLSVALIMGYLYRSMW